MNTTFKPSSTSIATTIAYLLGAKEEHFLHYSTDGEDFIKNLSLLPDVMIIRALNNIRSNLLLNHRSVESAMIYEFKNLYSLDMFSEDVKTLETYNVNIIKANYRVNKYVADINELIRNKIDRVKDLFPEWVN